MTRDEDIVTLYVAVPFARGADGDLHAGAARRMPSAGAAAGEARRMARTAAGALAFAQTGDRTSGAFDDAVVLRSFGEVPDLDAVLRDGGI